MTLLNSCLFQRAWPCVEIFVANNSTDLNRSVEQVFSPASPGGVPGYMLSHIWSKDPNIIELG